MDQRGEVKAFLTSRRARISPARAGLRHVDADRRVPGLRREEVAMLAGVSVDYYVKLERGQLRGVSTRVLEAVARALDLDSDELAYLLDLSRAANQRADTVESQSSPSGASGSSVTDSMQLVLDSLAVPAIILNRRLDVLASNELGRALHSGAYAMVFGTSERPNLARFTFLSPEAPSFYVKHDEAKDLTVAMLRAGTGHDPLDRRLTELIGELSTYRQDFAKRWAEHDVRRHARGRKSVDHPVVGRLELDFDDFSPPGSPDLMLTTYTAPQGSPTADGLEVLRDWATSQRMDHLTDKESPL